MRHNLNAWILAMCAAPAALLVGSAVWYVVAFGIEGLMVRLLWQSVMCFWVLIGSFILSPVFLVLERLRLTSRLRPVVLISSLMVAVAYVALFLAWQTAASDTWLLGAAALGLTLNGLAFCGLASSPNRTVERDGPQAARPSL